MYLTEVTWINIKFNLFKLIDIAQQINSIMLSVVFDEVGNNLVGHFNQILCGLLISDSEFILLANIAGQVAYILVAP